MCPGFRLHIDKLSVNAQPPGFDFDQPPGSEFAQAQVFLTKFAQIVFVFSFACKLSFFSVTLCLGDFVFSTECNLSLISLLSASVPQSLCVLEKNQRINTIFPNSFLK